MMLVLSLAGSAGYSTLGAQRGGAATKKEQNVKTAIDPVCGMQVDPAKAAAKSEYKGTTYYFCSEHCKKTFDANPEAVLKKQAQKK